MATIDYVSKKRTIRELKKALFWSKVRTVVWTICMGVVSGIIAFDQGYRRGCEDTINVVEQKVESLLKRFTGG
jgi:hypothetical protein